MQLANQISTQIYFCHGKCSFLFNLTLLNVCMFLMLTFCTFKACVPPFTMDRGNSVTHFIFLHHFGWPHNSNLYLVVGEDVKDEYV